MHYSLPSVATGWRGLATARQARARNRLAEGWWVICDPAGPRPTLDLSGEAGGAALSLTGTIGSAGLQIEIEIDPAALQEPPRSLSLMLVGAGGTITPLKRIAVRRRSVGAADLVRRLWQAEEAFLFDRDRATIPLGQEAGAALLAMARDAAAAGDQIYLVLLFGAGAVDLRLGDVALDSTAPPPLPKATRDPARDQTADDMQLAAQVKELLLRELPRRLREHLDAKDWAAFDRLGSVVEELPKAMARSAALVGRGRVLRGEHGAAAHAFDLATRLQPDGEEPRLSLGLALARGGDVSRGIAELGTVLAEGVRAPGGAARVRIELARALRRRMREAADAAQAAQDRVDAIAQLRLLSGADLDGTPRLMLADLLYEARAYADCLATLDGGELDDASRIAGLLLRSRALVALDRIDESLEVARTLLAVDPDNAAASFHLRTLRHFGSAARTGSKPPAPVMAGDGFAARLAECESDWVVPVDSGGTHPIEALPLPVSSDGFARLETAGGRIGAWRRDSLANLLASGLVAGDLSRLGEFEGLYGPRPVEPAADEPGTTVALMSRHGSYKFGGGEHFLESMADHYRSIGLDPLILGTRPEQAGERGITAAGHRFAFIGPTVPALLRCLVDHDARLIHAISGSGFLAAAAVAHSRIRLIYGIHYWRELLGDETDKSFFLEDGAPNPRLAFGYILSHADAVYANSAWVRGIVERCFGVRVPVVNSVPADLAA